MANNIALAEKYQPILDAVYKKYALTGALETAKVKFDNTNTIKILKVQVPTLGKYSRNSGFTEGDVNVEWETWTLTQDRGREFSIDAMDDEETVDTAFGSASNEFIRTKVVPQIDRYRFATLAQVPGITSVAEDLENGNQVIAALRNGTNKQEEDEVPEGSILFITPTNKGMADDVDSYKSKEVFKKFAQVIEVPQSRFFDKGEYDETEEFVKASDAVDINFMIVHPTAVEAVTKHAKLRVFSPDENQEKDAYKFQYRVYHDILSYENKVAGIYVSKKTK